MPLLPAVDGSLEKRFKPSHLPPGTTEQPLLPHAGSGRFRSPLRTFSSLCPTYMLMSSGPFTLQGEKGAG